MASFASPCSVPPPSQGRIAMRPCDGGDACPKTVALYRGNGVNANNTDAKRPIPLTENRAYAIHPKTTVESERGPPTSTERG